MSVECQCLSSSEPPCCAQCFSEIDVLILPAHKNGKFIGQFFLCKRCGAGLSGLDLEVTVVSTLADGQSAKGPPIIAA